MSTKPNGLLLAGGESRRMGRDKAALIYPALSPLPMAEYLAGLLRAHCEETFISRRKGQDSFEHLPALEDIFSEAGPASGLLAAAAKQRGAWLVLACDFPFARARDLRRLIEVRSGAATGYLQADGRPEPFFTLWEEEALMALQEDFSRGKQSPRATLERLSGRWLLPEDPKALRNINETSDLFPDQPHPR